ncbi:DUF6314 family protein [Streptomyces sp. SID8352]|uniref:DUF6314 family protein n=1 Tax=Streptomyces sp. SID8352 TaxID=2690338 RepID=UPI00136FE6EF|nr:DUF6314 family protein [Streptomyces sp. SID8352]MYU24530.1 hypothetical protein [Streptomyces sp. SID8352]
MDGHWPVPDVLAYLTGRWHTGRTVRDLAGDVTGRFEGTTVFRAAADGELLCRESGTLTWRGATRPAGRTLRYAAGGAPGTAEVRFADGRPFHTLDLGTGHHVAEHPCAADHYRGEFTVRDRDHWHLVWRVRGPAKDLLLSTGYTREN